MLTIDEKHLRANVKVETWQEAIKEVGQILVECGSIKKEYIESMIDIVNQLGPYIVIAPHIAIAHASPQNNVMRDDMAVMTLEKPVNFNCENDPVKVMICLAAVDGHAHLSLLQQLSNILSEEVCEKLIKCEKYDELVSIIKGCE